MDERPHTEEALKILEERYRIFTEMTSDYVYVIRIDPNGRPTMEWASGSMARVLGYTLEEYSDITKPLAHVHPDDVLALTENYQRLLKGEATVFERRVITKSGEERWIRNYSRPVWDETHSRVIAIYGAAQDITERKRAEQALRASEERYRYISELISDYAYAFRVEPDGTFRGEWLTDSFTRVFGYTKEEIEARGGWQSIVYPEDLPIAIQHAQKVASGQRDVCEWRFVTRAGEIRWIRDFAVPVWDEAHGRVVRIYGAAQDITERKRADHEIQQRLHELTLIHRASQQLQELRTPEALARTLISLLGETLRYEYAAVLLIDEPTQRLIPFALSERGREADKLYVAHNLKVGEGIAGWVAQTGQSVCIGDVRQDPYVMCPDIRSELCVPLKLGEKTIGVINVGSSKPNAYGETDQRILEIIAAQIAMALQNTKLFEQVNQSVRQLEALSRRLLEVQEGERRALAYELHDEIGQALTAIKLLIESSGELPEPTLRKRCEQVQELVRELLGKVRQLSVDLRPPMLDDLGLLPTLLWYVGRLREQAGMRIHFQHRGLVERRLAPQIEIVTYRIVQEALTNVIRHARVTEAWLSLWTEGDRLYVQIEDQGAGFDVEEVKRKAKSLGLRGMRERAELAGGKFLLDSAPGEGTRITVELPLSWERDRK